MIDTPLPSLSLTEERHLKKTQPHKDEAHPDTLPVL